MSAPVIPPQSRRHNLMDWLDLHGLDQRTCAHLLDEIEREFGKMPASRSHPGQQYLRLDPDGVWPIIVSAMCRFLPDHRSVIEETFERSEKIAVAGQGRSRKALTIDHGPEKYPTIMYHYFGEVSDLLVVAHEFGHALQIRASGGKFMPPVSREICAFLSEEALLSFCSKEDASLSENLHQHWQRSTHRYCGKLAVKLQESLTDENAIYEYGWNYPIARYLARRMFDDFPPNSIWEVYSGEYSIKNILDQLSISSL